MIAVTAAAFAVCLGTVPRLRAPAGGNRVAASGLSNCWDRRVTLGPRRVHHQPAASSRVRLAVNDVSAGFSGQRNSLSIFNLCSSSYTHRFQNSPRAQMGPWPKISVSFAADVRMGLVAEGVGGTLTSIASSGPVDVSIVLGVSVVSRGERRASSIERSREAAHQTGGRQSFPWTTRHLRSWAAGQAG